MEEERRNERVKRVLYGFFRVFCWLLCKVLFQLRAVGAHRVPKTGGVIIAANHPTYLDPPVLAACVRRRLSFVARAQLFSMPFVRAFLWVSDSVPIRQRAADMRAVRQAVRKLKQGDAVVIFPEGGREEYGRIGDGLPGAALVALLSGAPIVPCALIGAYAAWRMDAPFPLPHPITVVFGEPFHVREVEGLSRDDIIEEATQKVMAAIRELAQQGNTISDFGFRQSAKLLAETQNPKSEI